MKKGQIFVISLIIIISILMIVGAYILFTKPFENSKNIGESTIGLNLKGVYVENGNLIASVTRSIGKGQLTGIKFTLSGGNSTETIIKDSNLQEAKGETFILTPSQLSLLEIKTIFISPIFESSNKEKVVGKITDIYNFNFVPSNFANTFESNTQQEICTPNCIGLQCGFDSVCGQLCGECEGTDMCINQICVSQDCVPNSNTVTCGSSKCGTKTNNCGEEVNCGTCSTETCTPAEVPSVDTNCEGGTFIQTSCGNKRQFKIAFILLGNDSSEFTPEKINKVNEIKTILSNDSYIASQNKMILDTSYPVVTILTNDEMRTGNPDYQFNSQIIAKEFYKENPDSFDFIIVGTSFKMFRNNEEFCPQYYTTVQNFVSGIGRGIYDNTVTFGSNGKLLGVVFIADITRPNSDLTSLSTYGSVSNTLIHEITHQWCCYVGDNFGAGKDLEIIQNGMHFYHGLQSPYPYKDDPMGSLNWIPNPSKEGNFMYSTLYNHPLADIHILHPFALYLMGLLPESEYNTNYTLFNVTSMEFATPYKEVSVNNIIAIEGKRICSKT